MSERDELKPCPFCGGKADFERMGTSRQSCIVECGRCGVRHESSDEYGRSGQSWNERQPTRAPQAVPALTDERRRAAAKALVEVYLGFPAPHREPGDLDLRAVDAVASIILAAPQPSPEPKEAQ